jgi:hypothetical protein
MSVQVLPDSEEEGCIEVTCWVLPSKTMDSSGVCPLQRISYRVWPDGTYEPLTT